MTEYMTIDEALDFMDAEAEQSEWRRYQVHYPEASVGKYHIQHFTIKRDDETRAKILLREGLDRDTGHGQFTRLVEETPDDDDGNSFRGKDGKWYRVWMSDTRAEIMEHSPMINKLWWSGVKPDKDILINGLGLGVVVHAALEAKGVRHIDVVENNDDIIRLVRPCLPADKVTIHPDDAYTIQWPRGKRWDLAWHDIWPTITDDNLPEMDRLIAKYKHRVGWQGCWQRDGCLAMRKVTRQMQAGTLSISDAMDYLGGKAPCVK